MNNIAHCTFLVARKDGVSYEEFEAEYSKHILKAAPILQKYGATYYNVQFNSPASRAAATATLGLDEETARLVIPEHDAITTIKFPDLAAFKAFTASPENQKQLAPDGPRFTEQSKQRLSIGTERMGIEGGNVLV